MADLVPQLNAVITGLRSLSTDYESRRQKLRGVFYCLPLIKNKQNLWTLLQEFALSPGLFNGTQEENVEMILYAIDGIQFSAERKHQISSPTLPPALWVKEIVEIAHTLPPLIGLILVSGLSATNLPTIPEVVRFSNAVSRNRELVVLCAACLSRAQWSYHFTAEVYQSVEAAEEMLRLVCSEVIFTQRNLSLDTAAIKSQLGSWSRLIAGLLLVQPFHALLKYLETSQLFARTIVAQGYDPETVKPFFFGTMIQLEGVAKQILTNKSLHSKDRTRLVILVLENLQPLGYVIQTVGSTFDSYQFVLNVCLDALSVTPAAGDTVQDAGPAVVAVSALGEHWAFGQPVTSIVAAGDLVVFLEIAEQLMPVLPTPKADQLVIPIALRFLHYSEHLNVFETAHSVVLAYLATHHSFRYSKARLAVQYFDQLMRLFPSRLTATQFRTAVEAVLRAVDDTGARYVLDGLFQAAKRSVPGFPLQPPTTPQPYPELSMAPTLRAALLSALLHAAAGRCNAQELDIWLHRITPMVPEAYSPAAKEEREFLIRDFKDVTTSLGAETSDVGIKWFFNAGWNKL